MSASVRAREEGRAPSSSRSAQRPRAARAYSRPSPAAATHKLPKVIKKLKSPSLKKWYVKNDATSAANTHTTVNRCCSHKERNDWRRVPTSSISFALDSVAVRRD